MLGCREGRDSELAKAALTTVRMRLRFLHVNGDVTLWADVWGFRQWKAGGWRHCLADWMPRSWTGC
jgi:hypothetical protein